MLYDLFIHIYKGLIATAGLFDDKVKKMKTGQQGIRDTLKKRLKPDARYIWFHAASLGEFEQGRPLMEYIKEKHPQYHILLTFFSPSGYEVRKDYPLADIVCYLPLDTKANAEWFVQTVRPVMAFFIKYEFWYNYLHALRKRQIPTYSVSSIFRPDQIFFKSYAAFYTKVLHCFTHFYVQNEQSRQLLETIGITAVTVVGDTRFDRVVKISQTAPHIPLIQAFSEGSTVLVVGSSWPEDEAVYIPHLISSGIKAIIAPHVVDEQHLRQLEQNLRQNTLRYSQANEHNIASAKYLIIDSYGMLSTIYRYGTIAYVGGGFGAGIHNLPEAAVWGIPVIFGPNSLKFNEARQLVNRQGGMRVTDRQNYENAIRALLQEPQRLRQMGKEAGRYINECGGATHKIMSDMDFRA